MRSFLVDVSKVLREPGTSLEFDETVDIESLTIGDTTAVFLAHPRVRVSIICTGDDLTLLGSVSGSVNLECSRCLEPYMHAVEGSLEGLIVNRTAGAAIPADEEWYPLEENGTVDLLPAVEAALTLEIPYAPLHSEECRGICPTCGCDRNQMPCSCVAPTAEADSPFAVLKDLVDSSEG